MYKISIVTPSFNQASLLEDTIISVLSQGYPNLEYIIIDGGSTDGSVDIIKKYADRLVYWVSEPDEGRGDAVNKGFKHSTGEIMAWMGCGDQYCAWAFRVVNEIFEALPEVEWLTTRSRLSWIGRNKPSHCSYEDGFSRQAFFDGLNLPLRNTIQQESTFWRRSIWKRAGGYVDEKFWIVPDFELWFRFWQHGLLYAASVPLGGARYHEGKKEAFPTAFKTARRILRKPNSRSIFLYYYKQTRCIISQIPFLKHFVKYQSNIIDYDFDLQKWISKKIFL